MTLLEPLDAWNPFDLLLERDSSRTARPDLALAAAQEAVPAIGVVLVHAQSEYGNGRHAQVDAMVDRVLDRREASRFRIDTRLDDNGTGLRTSGEVESAIAHMDAIVTTRLHGLVLSIKNGVAPVVIDPIPGGAKVLRQARTLGWPVAFDAGQIDERALSEALDYCLTVEARDRALACREAALPRVHAIGADFVREMTAWRDAAA